MMRKSEVYARLKIAGMLSLVPFILGAGPFCGWYLGIYLQGKFNAPAWALYLCVAAGIAASVQETIRIIRIAIKAQNNDRG